MDFEENSHVGEFAESDLKKFTDKESNKIYMVLFYLSTGSYGDFTGKMFEDATNKIRNTITIGRVNCHSSEYRKACEDLGVKLDSIGEKADLRLYVQGKKTKYYKKLSSIKEKTVDAFVQGAVPSSFALKKESSNIASLASNEAALTDWLLDPKTKKASWGASVVCVGSVHADFALLLSVHALRHQGQIAFAEQSNDGQVAALSQAFELKQDLPTIVAICNGDASTYEVFPHPLDPKNVARVTSKFGTWLMGFYDGKKCFSQFKVDADTDLNKLKVGQLKEILKSQGKSCSHCIEKSDYVNEIQTSLKTEL